ncbi:MAG: CheR family methyltransferase [Myxococcaceae bacterium]
MDSATFAAFRALAYDQAGIDLGPNKAELVSARVARRVKELGLGSPREYADLLAADEGGQELVKFLDAISTNFTSFFREPSHFDELRDHARARLLAGQKRFRFWSAASSSGEEPYTMAMVLADVFDNHNVDWALLATDISTKVLGEASEGIYTAQQVQAVPAQTRARHFKVLRTGGETQYAVNEALKKHVTFARMNLSTPPFPMKGPFDAIFCRNVMIYFDQRVRQGLVSEAERLLAPGANLFISHTETLTGVSSGLSQVRPSVYLKR